MRARSLAVHYGWLTGEVSGRVVEVSPPVAGARRRGGPTTTCCSCSRAGAWPTATPGCRTPKRGWIRQDDLLRMLRIDENHLNITVHRARSQLAKAGVADAAALIERRPQVRQLRIGVRDLELVAHDEPRAG